MTQPALCYSDTVKATSIVPEHIYARCDQLTTFHFELTPVRRAPRPGQKPTKKRKR